MIEIIPAINVDNFEEATRRIKLASEVCSMVHIDIADGTFTPHPTWFNPSDLAHFESPVQIEMHFMVKDPELKLQPWLLPNVQRVLFHIESTKSPEIVLDQCRKASKEVGLCMRTGTNWQELVPFIGRVDCMQTLAVMPGPSGQSFTQETLEVLKELRFLAPSMPLEVDGGIRVGVARSCALAGATRLVAGSALFGEGIDFKEAFHALKDDSTA